MALVPITHVYDTLSVINNTGLLDGQILYTTDQTVNKIFADVKVNNILRRIEIGGTNEIDTELNQTSGHAIANSAVAKLAQTIHTNIDTTNSNLTALDTKVGAQSLLPTPSQSVTQNINTLKAEINRINADLSDKQDAIKTNLSKRTLASAGDSEINVIKTFILNAKSRYVRVAAFTHNGGSNSLIIDSNFLNYCNENSYFVLNSILPDNGTYSWSVSFYIDADKICLTRATKGSSVGWLTVYVNEFYQA